MPTVLTASPRASMPDSVHPGERPLAFERTRPGEAAATLSPAELAQRYWHAAIRWRVLIGATMLACMIAGVVWTMLTPPRYTARAQIEISRVKKNVTNVQGLEQAGDSYDAEFYDTQYNLLRAGSLAERVARKLRLAEAPDFFAAQGIRLANGRALDGAERKRREELAAGILAGGIRITPVRNSSLVDITFTGGSPEWAARIANAWPQEFIAATMDREYASNADARKFLVGMLRDLRGKLEQSERDLANFATDRGIVKLASTIGSDGATQAPRTLVEANLEALNEALNAARTERIAAESRLGSASSVLAADGAIGTLRTRRAEVGAEYAQLLRRFKPGYPAAQALKAQMDELDAAIGREMSRLGTAQTAAYREALKREQVLEVQVSQLKGDLDRQQRDGIQYNIYQREADTNRQLYEALLQRYKEIGVAGTVGSSNIAIVDPAKVPGGPTSPDMRRNLMLALLAGLGISALAVFLLEQINDRLRDAAHAASALGLPNLGTVPRTDNDPLEAIRDLKSDFSEAYFSIRTTLAFATSHGLPRSFVVTSTQPGEGKSTTAMALAAAIGRTGKRVLLIDADMRSPSAHKLVNSSNLAGFSNMLTGQDEFASLISQTDLRGVWILPAGPNPPSAAELLGADRLGFVLGMLQQAFDQIVIDGPPVLGLADAPLLVRAAEGCVFVVAADSTRVSAIRNALRRIHAVNGHLFGMVLSKVAPARGSYGYAYRYKSETQMQAA